MEHSIEKWECEYDEPSPGPRKRANKGSPPPSPKGLRPEESALLQQETDERLQRNRIAQELVATAATKTEIRDPRKEQHHLGVGYIAQRRQENAESTESPGFCLLWTIPDRYNNRKLSDDELTEAFALYRTPRQNELIRTGIVCFTPFVSQDMVTKEWFADIVISEQSQRAGPWTSTWYLHRIMKHCS